MPKRRRSRKVTLSAFPATRNMLRYRDALLDALARNKRLTVTDLAAAAGIARERISRWERKPGFVTWLEGEIDSAVRRLANRMHYAQMQTAIGGSLPHYQTQLRRLGQETPWEGPHQVGDSGPQTVNGVQVHIHGIPSPVGDRSTLPPPIMRHPVTGEIVPIPPKEPRPLDDAQTAGDVKEKS